MSSPGNAKDEVYPGGTWVPRPGFDSEPSPKFPLMKATLSTILWHSESPVVKVTTVRTARILWARAAFLEGGSLETWQAGPRPLKSEKPIQVPWSSAVQGKTFCRGKRLRCFGKHVWGVVPLE